MSSVKPNIAGGKRKVNKGLKDWVTFVKKVQKEEKLSYKDAIHRAKIRKDKGEKWMTGGSVDDNCKEEEDALANCKTTVAAAETIMADKNVMADEEDMDNAELLSSEVAEAEMNGGRRRRHRRRTMRKSRGGRRTMRRSRRRTSRRR
jgi:hypothetical protein